MRIKDLGIAAAVLAAVGATGVGLAVAQSPGVARRTTPAAPPGAEVRLPPPAALIYNYIKQERPDAFKWQRIPWLINLPEAVRQARDENRPILIWISVGAPLERC